MEFEISAKGGSASGGKNITNIVVLARAIGYVIIDTRDNGEYNLVRKLTGNNYPRFHIYLKVAGDRFVFNLHLDQKQPSYQGSHAHSGEYAGPVVEGEADRIRSALDTDFKIEYT